MLEFASKVPGWQQLSRADLQRHRCLRWNPLWWLCILGCAACIVLGHGFHATFCQGGSVRTDEYEVGNRKAMVQYPCLSRSFTRVRSSGGLESGGSIATPEASWEPCSWISWLCSPHLLVTAAKRTRYRCKRVFLTTARGAEQVSGRKVLELGVCLQRRSSQDLSILQERNRTIRSCQVAILIQLWPLEHEWPATVDESGLRRCCSEAVDVFWQRYMIGDLNLLYRMSRRSVAALCRQL